SIQDSIAMAQSINIDFWYIKETCRMVFKGSQVMKAYISTHLDFLDSQFSFNSTQVNSFSFVPCRFFPLHAYNTIRIISLLYSCIISSFSSCSYFLYTLG